MTDAPPHPLDHDASGRKGGSRPGRYPMIDRRTGALIVVVGAALRDARLADASARRATREDLDIAGRLDLAGLL